MSNELFSEQFRIVAKEAVDARAAANLLKECKTITLSRMVSKMLEDGTKAQSWAEREARASIEYEEYVKSMIEAIKRAEFLEAKKETIRMRYWEHQGDGANRRAEMRL